MNLARLIELERMEQGLRLDMGAFFCDSPKAAVEHPCETACCHAGWAIVFAHATGHFVEHGFAQSDRNFRGDEIAIAGRFLELSYMASRWLFVMHSHILAGDNQNSYFCTEREGRLRLRILIELQSEDVELLTAELNCRMTEPVEAPVVEEIPVEVCA